jgi:uncharacterized protein (DUF2147 family)
MTTFIKRILKSAAIAACVLAPGAAFAGDATGVWIDHTGRGAVEISHCGGALCGRVVWLKNANDGKACGTQVIGGVKPVAGGKWDGGWIYDPEERAKYSVELTPVGANKLKVMGYQGTKFLSETFMWTRAAGGALPRCHV